MQLRLNHRRLEIIALNSPNRESKTFPYMKLINMQVIKELLNKERFKRNESKRKINLQYEKAKEFAQYVGLKSPIFVMKLFKNFGENKVLGIKSWIKDAPNSKNLPPEGLIVWKLKQG